MKSARWLKLFIGVVIAAAGVLSLFQPKSFITALVWAVSCLIFVAGVLRIVSFFRLRKEPYSFFFLIQGLVDVALSVLFLSSALGWVVIEWAPLFGLWAIVTGAVRAVEGLSSMKSRPGPFWSMLFTGVNGILLGVCFWLTPVFSALTSGVMIGIALLVIALFSVLDFFTN